MPASSRDSQPFSSLWYLLRASLDLPLAAERYFRRQRVELVDVGCSHVCVLEALRAESKGDAADGEWVCRHSSERVVVGEGQAGCRCHERTRELFVRCGGAHLSSQPPAVIDLVLRVLDATEAAEWRAHLDVRRVGLRTDGEFHDNVGRTSAGPRTCRDSHPRGRPYRADLERGPFVRSHLIDERTVVDTGENIAARLPETVARQERMLGADRTEAARGPQSHHTRAHRCHCASSYH